MKAHLERNRLSSNALQQVGDGLHNLIRFLDILSLLVERRCLQEGKSVAAGEEKGAPTHLGVSVDRLGPVALFIEDVVTLVAFGKVGHREGHESEIPETSAVSSALETESASVWLTNSRCDRAIEDSSQFSTCTQK